MRQPFQLQGHRGARGLFPENTLGGFRRAIALGVRWFELDVGVLGDGTVVVHHDPALNPDLARRDGTWCEAPGPLLRDMTLSALRGWDVGRIRPGSATAARFPDQVPEDGAGVPTLAEVLALDGVLGWTIEVKSHPERPGATLPAEAMVDCVLSVLDSVRPQAAVTLQSFDWRAPRHARRLRPGQPVGWLTHADTVRDPVTWWGLAKSRALPEAVAAEGGGLWTPYWEELREPDLRRAQALGLIVVPWTVNDAGTMARLIGMGVDGLITDYPDRALPLVA